MVCTTKIFKTKVLHEPGKHWVIARISTTAVDRDGDVLLPRGLDLTDFHKNPQVLFSHDQVKMPIGRAINIKRTRDDVTAKVIFADRPASLHPTQEWVPDTIHELFKQNVYRAFSVGFEIKPGGQRMADIRDVKQFGEGVKRVIEKWKLVEFSVVSVGSNQDALAIAVSKGLISSDTVLRDELIFEDTLDMLDGPDPILEIPSAKGGSNLPLIIPRA